MVSPGALVSYTTSDPFADGDEITGDMGSVGIIKISSGSVFMLEITGGGDFTTDTTYTITAGANIGSTGNLLFQQPTDYYTFNDGVTTEDGFSGGVATPTFGNIQPAVPATSGHTPGDVVTLTITPTVQSGLEINYNTRNTLLGDPINDNGLSIIGANASTSNYVNGITLDQENINGNEELGTSWTDYYIGNQNGAINGLTQEWYEDGSNNMFVGVFDNFLGNTFWVENSPGNYRDAFLGFQNSNSNFTNFYLDDFAKNTQFSGLFSTYGTTTPGGGNTGTDDILISTSGGYTGGNTSPTFTITITSTGDGQVLGLVSPSGGFVVGDSVTDGTTVAVIVKRGPGSDCNVQITSGPLFGLTGITDSTTSDTATVGFAGPAGDIITLSDTDGFSEVGNILHASGGISQGMEYGSSSLTGHDVGDSWSLTVTTGVRTSLYLNYLTGEFSMGDIGNGISFSVSTIQQAIEFFGGEIHTQRGFSDNFTFLSSDHMVVLTVAGKTATLPELGGTVTLAAFSGDSIYDIGGAVPSLTLADGESYTVEADAAYWAGI